MILKLKDYHKTDKNYKKFSNNSSQNWDLMIKVLGSWGYINEIQTGIFKKFLRYRNESVHFNKCHPFKNKEDIILEDFTKLFNGLFGIFERRDIIKSVPGEFWIRPDMMGNPFVKEFFIPSGYQSAYMGNIFDDLYSEESVKP